MFWCTCRTCCVCKKEPSGRLPNAAVYGLQISNDRENDLSVSERQPGFDFDTEQAVRATSLSAR